MLNLTSFQIKIYPDDLFRLEWDLVVYVFHGIFSSNLMNLSAIKLFLVFPDFSLNVYRISAYGSSLIPGFGHLNLLSFYSGQSGQIFINCSDFLQETAFHFIDVSIFYFIDSFYYFLSVFIVVLISSSFLVQTFPYFK